MTPYSYIYTLEVVPDPARLERDIRTSAIIAADPAAFVQYTLVAAGTSMPDVAFVFSQQLQAAAKTELDALVAGLDPTPLDPDNWTVAELGMASGTVMGEERFATDGRTAAQGPGDGTGVWVYWDDTSWNTVYGNAAVQA